VSPGVRPFRHAPRNPEAQGATSLFEDRWMASAPLNMSPLFAAGHVIATTTVDRFLMDARRRVGKGVGYGSIPINTIFRR
jgi:hypothetical protein